MTYEVTFAVGYKNGTWKEEVVGLPFHDQTGEQTYSEWQRELEDTATDILMKKLAGKDITFVTMLNYKWVNDMDVL